MTRAVIALIAAHGALAADTNPMAKVFELMDDCAAKVRKDGESEAKAYREYFSWCDDTAKNAQFEIKTFASEKEELEATIGEEAANIAASTSKIEELSAAIAADTAELKEAQGIRDKEADDFAKSEAELVDTVDTLERAVGILEREMAGSSFAQFDTSNVKMLAKALGPVLDAAAFAGADKKKVMALLQAQSDDDDDETGAPAAAVTEGGRGNGIVDVLTDMKDKAESELDELRKAENSAQHNFNMLKQSLEDQIKADSTDLDQEKAALSTSEETKATAEGDLGVTSKNLAAEQAGLAEASSSCMQVAADHEATVAARKEELAVIAKAKQILEETTNGAASFLQRSSIKTRADLKNSEVVHAIANLGKVHHSAALTQLASKIAAVIRYGGGADVFAKIKGMIGDMIAKLEKEAADDATEKAYCDEEMAKTEAKKAEVEDDLSAVSAKIDKATSSSAKLKSQTSELQSQLATLAKEQAEMDTIRGDQHAAYSAAKADLDLALSGVGKALDVLRDYYGGASAAFLQDDISQPAKPAKFEKKGGAGGSIISILEVCESDFSDNLAKEEMAESDALEEYEKITQENKVTKVTKDQDVKYKTQEFKSLDKEISELSGDKATLTTESDAVNEYYGKLRERCVAKPESYEDRAARREAEIEGLKDGLVALESDTAFVQRKHRGGLRGSLSM